MSIQAMNNAVSDSYTMPAQTLAPAEQEPPPPPPPPEQVEQVEPPPLPSENSTMESTLPGGSRVWEA